MRASNHSKISYTAIFCAKALTYNPNIPYAREIYKKIREHNLDKGIKTQIALSSIGARIFSGIGLLMTFIEARYIGMNKILERLRYPDVLELASGLAPRGLELNNKSKIIETDLDNIVNIKKRIIKEINSKEIPIILPLNVLDRQEFLRMGKKFNNKRKIAIIHSGLWTYLNKEEQKKLASNIQEFLNKYCKKGYWITSDIRPKSEFKNRFFKFFRKGITKRTGRSPTRFNSDEELREFMKDAGFKVKIINILNEIYDKLYIPKKFDLKKEDVAAQSQGMKMYIMELK